MCFIFFLFHSYSVRAFLLLNCHGIFASRLRTTTDPTMPYYSTVFTFRIFASFSPFNCSMYSWRYGILTKNLSTRPKKNTLTHNLRHGNIFRFRRESLYKDYGHFSAKIKSMWWKINTLTHIRNIHFNSAHNQRNGRYMMVWCVWFLNGQNFEIHPSFSFNPFCIDSSL